jgi:hypothetical protein
VSGLKTYWFTIASGSPYRDMARNAARLLKRHGIELDILGSDALNREESKFLKIRGILNAPSDCDRIVYLDADTIVLNPDGIDGVNGSWRIPWNIPVEDCIPKDLDARRYAGEFEAFHRRNGIIELNPGGEYGGVEWNSGVIVGNRDTLVELAEEWAFWWKRINRLFGERFRRDQVSFRIAYYRVMKKERRSEDLPAIYNWVVSYSGINPNANVLHRTMVKNVGWLARDWEKIFEEADSGADVRTKNRVFDIGPIQDTKPCLKRCIHVNPETVEKRLSRLYALQRPERVLVWTESASSAPFLSGTDPTGGKCEYADSPDPPEAMRRFDTILFDGVDPSRAEGGLRWIRRDAVCCLIHSHRLEYYRTLFRFSYVRFVDYSMAVFSDSPKILEWKFDE